MNNKLAYLIFGLSLIIFICVYIYVPTINVGDEDFDSMREEKFVDDAKPIDSDIIGKEAVIEQYKGEITLSRIWIQIKLIFTSYSRDVIAKNLSFQDYYNNNREKVEQIYGSVNEEEFVDLFNSFKDLGTPYSASILKNTIKENENGIEFAIIVYAEDSLEDGKRKYKFYICNIYNKEEKKDVIFKIEPYLVDMSEVGA